MSTALCVCEIIRFSRYARGEEVEKALEAHRCEKVHEV